MYNYLFTNDLRISTLDSSLKETAVAVRDDEVPSAQEDKSINNNMMTLIFYFNLQKDNRCTMACSNGDTRKVVLNFIKKFQFPNPRTTSSFDKACEDGIQLAPMRVVLQLLYLMRINNVSEAYLTKQEILDYVFLNDDIAKNQNPDLIKTMRRLLSERENRVDTDFPDDTELEAKDVYWKHCSRQLREMVKILTYSGCAVETDGKIMLREGDLTLENKADLYDILTYNRLWKPDKNKSFDENKESYQQYMDLSTLEISKIRAVRSSFGGDNILLYGVPGAGKSYTVKQDYIKDSENVERVVFHPDYTYSDFVGQILPVVHDDKSVSYEFVAGPFTRILKAAWNDPDNHYWLIIEEINRGNAPAIFGDLFQLLDRKDDGTSEYEITNADIAKVVFEDNDRKVGLPGNLSIIATMNTSDQNVFTLDTAFQRRWVMRLIDNDFDACEDTELMTSEVVDTGVQWKDFGKEINKRIIEANSGNMISTADKQLGTHFVSKNELSKTDVFAEKVLKYLWDDAVKLNHEQVFDPNYKELREVVKDFKAGEGPAKLDVFNKTVRKALQTIIDGINDRTFDSNEEPNGSEDN